MSSEVLRVIDPRGYFARFIEEGIYPDGRGLLEEHKLVFKKGECGGVGSSVVSTHGVTVSCSIEASISLASDADLVDVKIESSQQLSEKQADDYNNLLLSLFNSQFFVRRDNLKCKDAAGEKLPLDWQLHVTLKVLSLEGSLLDAVVCAICVALADVKLPSILLNHASEDESAIEKSQIQADIRSMYKLELEEALVCCSFGVFKAYEESAEVLLLSPTSEATAVCRSTCSMVLGAKDKIVLMRERGNISSFVLLKTMSGITAERRRKFVEALKNSI